jgi:peptide/nickel transport system permease protein
VPAFILRRLLFIAILAFAIVYFCTLGMRLTVNSTTNINRQTLASAAEPALDETVDFFEAAVRGELGYVVRGVTERSAVPIGALVADALLTSAKLVVTAIGGAAMLGILAGGLAATRRHSPLSLSTLTLTVIGVSIPSFFLALLLRVADIAFYRWTGVGLVPVFSSSMDRTQSLLPSVTFPALVLAARPLAHITRVAFVSVSEVLNRDFIRTARSKGLSQRVVFWRHTLRNAGISILTAAVVSLRFALGSLPVVEIFFDWPGVGSTMLNAIFSGETRVVAALGLALGVTFLLINLMVDLVYRWIDPRLRDASNGRVA